SKYLRAVSAAQIDLIPEKRKKHRTPDCNESDIEHQELFLALKDWRSRKAAKKQLAPFQVLHQKALIQIAVYLPGNIADLKKIQGVGKKTIEKYGKELVEQVLIYRKKHGIDKVLFPDSEKLSAKNPPSATKQTSLEMFNNGLTITGIAEKRGLVQSTIEGHLAFFVENGQLDINKLLSPGKQQAIEKELAREHNNSLSEVKRVLGNDYSYGEIKMMAAHLTHPE
ncbi:MAG: helicase, partial [Deltaproteobacteria bacterium]|nr:helicase [Deltaproteobacteria bacterium]